MGGIIEKLKPLQIMPHQRKIQWAQPVNLWRLNDSKMSAQRLTSSPHQRFQDERSASNIKPASAILLYFGTHFLRARLHSLVISGILHFVPPIPVNACHTMVAPVHP